MAADRSQAHQIQVHPQHRYDGGGKTFLPENQRGPTTSQVMAVITGLPVGGTLLGLAGLTFVGTLIGLAVVTPLFILFSPVLVPAALALGLAVTGFLTSGAFGLTALASLSWVMNYIRMTQGTVPEQLDHAKRRAADMAGYVGQKTKEVGQDIQSKAQEVKRS
ncbi:Oleosin family protein [Quillaja saponaria]|uniref:Oleosin family protein n=1 Tax=Quillaja saponaria TaxID=32244 RepID=A0AAD7Q496_QUISA|nr:Oleosin family protein [Quillaja saponaria]